jgi:hypothetical protein
LTPQKAKQRVAGKKVPHTVAEAEPVPANCTCVKLGNIVIALKLLAIIDFASGGAG